MQKPGHLTLIWSVVLSMLAAAPAAGINLENTLRQIIRAGELHGTRVAMMVMDLDTQNVLAHLNPDEAMIPASNMKLITTAAALDVLGPDFAFNTTLSLIDRSDARNGAASLLVRGDGDPAFGDQALLAEHGLTAQHLFDKWVDAVAATERRHFDELLIDDRIFDRELVHPAWPENQLHRGYCAQVAGLNFYQNCIDVLPVPTTAGQSPLIRLFPEARFVETTNGAVTGPTDHFTVYRKRGTNELVFGGSVRNRRATPFQVTVHDPPLFFAELFAARLAERGITIRSIRRVGDHDQLPESLGLHRVRITLPLVLRRTNQDSQNMFAEALFKRMGFAITGVRGSWENGAAAVRIFLQQRLGTPSSAVTVSDGSGLSRENKVTARLLVALLGAMHRDPGRRELFRRSLAEGGASGTLKNRFEKLNGTVYGKSGYLRSVSGVSGYLVLPASGANEPPRTIGFSFLFNGFSPRFLNDHVKKVQNRLVELVDQTLAPPVKVGG